MSFVRHLVSQDKVRYIDSEFDIDLTYITQNIIAMGFPASGFEATYRNPVEEVANFLEQNHSGHYKIFNLSEKPYDSKSFKGPIEYFPFPDHHPPPLDLLLHIIKLATEWLDKDRDNVIVVHCLAGMGRTGTVISSILLFTGQAPTAKDALEHFAALRTGTGAGVSKPCQRRYVNYAERLLAMAKQKNYDIYTLPPVPSRVLKKLSIINLSKTPKISYITIQNSEWDIIFNSSWVNMEPEKPFLCPIFDIYTTVKGDFTINVYEVKKSVLQQLTSKHIIYFSCSTLFLHADKIIIKKSLLDIIGGDKNDEKFPPDLNILLELEPDSDDYVVENLDI